MFYTLNYDKPREMRANFANMRRIGLTTAIAAVVIVIIQLKLYALGAQLDPWFMTFNSLCVIVASVAFRYSVIMAEPIYEAAIAWKSAAQGLENALNAKISENDELRKALAEGR